MGLGHSSAYTGVLQVLRRIGAYSLSMGRIYEGHVNALLLLNQYGSAQQKQLYFAQAKAGLFFGVWNSEIPTEKLQIEAQQKHWVLNGAKIFCSGANHSSTAYRNGGFGSRREDVGLAFRRGELGGGLQLLEPAGHESLGKLSV